MNLIPRIDGEFEGEFDTYVPKEGEVRILANRNQECEYYYAGIEDCRKNQLKMAFKDKNQSTFLPCKRIVDAHYRCMTSEKYGYTLEDAP